MGARDALASLRRKQAFEPASRELLLSRRHARLLADNPDAPPRDYAEEPQPFEAKPMFDLCEAILIGGMVVTLGAVLIWHAVRLLWI
ncbi:hypothetical protein N7E70_015810 [Aminobacter sp. NyZ550]|uniref:hypothetical protein n=1 Tax=Aminobacter sp. NyZ550 TaxID=2979870 RepID=UPI0021D5F63E|nr:hypothetical protein [Aminobacter sp. NyZ550]WAX93163.1 hypothetical protein N7E70_015810 [Aminobacter sp. NyZ550]